MAAAHHRLDRPYRQVFRLAWPLILSNITVPLLGMVDTAVVGHLPEPHHLGAVALGSTTFSALYFAFVFLRMGTTGLTAQAYGAGSDEERRASLLRPLGLALLIALLLIVLTSPIVALAVRIYAPGPRIEAVFETYLRIRLLGAPAALGSMVLLGWLLGNQDARGPLVMMVLANAVNIVLDLVFVVGFGLGAAGVAWATVIAEYAGLGLGVRLALRRLRGLGGALTRARLTDLMALRRLLAVNRDILLRSLFLQAAFVAVASLGARQGEVVLAANAVLLNLHMLASYGLDGFAHAAEALVGRCAGARDAVGLRAAVRASLAWSLGLATLLCAGFWLTGASLVALLTDLPEVRSAAGAYLPYLIALPVLSIWAFLFDGIFIGATRTAEMRNGMALALAVFALGAWLLVPAFGNHGLWLAFLIFTATRGLWLGLAYLLIEARSGGFAGARD